MREALLVLAKKRETEGAREQFLTERLSLDRRFGLDKYRFRTLFFVLVIDEKRERLYPGNSDSFLRILLENRRKTLPRIIRKKVIGCRCIGISLILPKGFPFE